MSSRAVAASRPPDVLPRRCLYCQALYFQAEYSKIQDPSEPTPLHAEREAASVSDPARRMGFELYYLTNGHQARFIRAVTFWQRHKPCSALDPAVWPQRHDTLQSKQSLTVQENAIQRHEWVWEQSDAKHELTHCASHAQVVWQDLLASLRQTYSPPLSSSETQFSGHRASKGEPSPDLDLNEEVSNLRTHTQTLGGTHTEPH